MKLHQRLRRDQGRHADDWLITYADTITLLLCLFVVILSIKTNGKSLARDLPGPAVQTMGIEDKFDIHPVVRAFPPEDAAPYATIVEAPPPVVEMTRNVAVAAAWVPVVVQPVVVQPVVIEPVVVKPVVAGPVVVAPAVVAPDATVPTAAEPTRTAPELESSPSAAERLKSLGAGVVRHHGDRITTLQINSAAFFGSGNAVLSEPGKAILRDVAVTLKSAEYASYRIAVEGHTDDSPINTVQFQSNWELSTARAAAVVRFFLEQAIPAARLTAAGYADTFPVAPNRTVDGAVIPENQARNRRVVIKLEKIDKADRSADAG